MFLAVALMVGCAPHRQPLRPEVVSQGGVVHLVSRGETLWSISRRYQVELEALADLNQITNASQIQVGQKLRIPEKRQPVRKSRRAVASRRTVESVRPKASRVEEHFIWPVRGKIISVFGGRRGGMVNKGLDIEARSGTEVLAARGGRVSFIHQGLPGFGKTIIIDHGAGLASVYAHVKEIFVQYGDEVQQRHVIARVGQTGRAEVPALHFEIRKNQEPQNPLYYLP